MSEQHACIRELNGKREREGETTSKMPILLLLLSRGMLVQETRLNNTDKGIRIMRAIFGQEFRRFLEG